MKINKIANGAEYRMYEHFQNLLIFWISIIFQIKKKFEFQKYVISKVPKISDLDN